MPDGECSVGGCYRKVVSLGLCYLHYAWTRGACEFPGCKRPKRYKQFCSTHYDHARGKTKPHGTIEQRFFRKVEKTDSCWIWKGGVSSSGYGSFGYNGKTELPHRVAWILEYGGMPEYASIHQKCHNILCVRIEHLELSEVSIDYTLTLRERFFRRVKKTDTCWQWLGSLDAHGYGALRYQGKGLKAHRISWELHFGPIPDNVDLEEMKMFIRLTEQLMAIVLGLEPSNALNSFDHLQNFFLCNNIPKHYLPYHVKIFYRNLTYRILKNSFLLTWNKL